MRATADGGAADAVEWVEGGREGGREERADFWDAGMGGKAVD